MSVATGIAAAHERLGLVGSEARARVLVDELRRTPSKPSARRLLREWFNLCDALEPWSDDLREQFERVGFVTDAKDRLELPATVWRAAWSDNDVARALSWTADVDTAERFARYLTSHRAWWLGIKRDDAEPWIWKGECTEAYGYLTSRNEDEVIAKTVVNIIPVAALRLVSHKED